MKVMFAACLGWFSVIAIGTADAAEHWVPAQYSTIQAAINAAAPGDTVVVSDGVYTGQGNRDISFAGKAITVRSQHGAASCVIDCAASPQNPHRGFRFAAGETESAVLDGFTITNGNTLVGAVADQFNGGGILFNNSSPTIRNCVLTGNSAACWGGAVCCTNASPTIVNCRIVGNTVGDDGGGLFAWQNSRPLIVNTVIAGNTAGSVGGAITNFGAMATVINCTIVGNTAPFIDGVYAWNSVIRNSIIWGNGSGSSVQGGTNTVIEYSIVQGGHPGAGNLNTDPHFMNPLQGDYHPALGSPAVNAASATFVPSAGALDLDGHARVLCGQADMGAYENGIGDYECDGDVDLFDFLHWSGCYNGPDGALLGADCASFDFNGDFGVDWADFAGLQRGWPAP